jgi:hypothetical protein
MDQSFVMVDNNPPPIAHLIANTHVALQPPVDHRVSYSTCNLTNQFSHTFQIFILEGDGHEQTAVEKENADLAEDTTKARLELQRLRGLLTDNNIPWTPSLTNEAIRTSNRSLKRPAPVSLESTRILRARGGGVFLEPEPETGSFLPLEVLLRILSYTVTSSVPIIDPFFKLRKGNCTREEYSTKKKYCINFLATSTTFNVEGTRLLITCNDFIFTQAAALQTFQKISLPLRSKIENITLRVVGQYYDEEPRKQDLSGQEHYHPSHPNLVMPILARPPGLFQDDGVQSYCWLQVSDFFKAMMVPLSSSLSDNALPSSRKYEKLVPNLKSLRLDLVNFSDHLPRAGPRYASVIRWYVGRITDELLLTGKR